MTSNGSFEGETRLAQFNFPSEESQRISVQVGNSMDQFSSIQDFGRKSSVDLPNLALYDTKSSTEKQIIQVKDQKEQNPPDKNDGYMLKQNPPDKNDGYLLADDPIDKFRKDTNAHNKKVFDEVDTDGNGKLSLKELEAATSAPKSDLTYDDLENLNRQQYNMLKKLGIAGEYNTHKFDLDLPEFLIENRSKY